MLSYEICGTVQNTFFRTPPVAVFANSLETIHVQLMHAMVCPFLPRFKLHLPFYHVKLSIFLHRCRKMLSDLNVQNALLVISRRKTKMENNYAQSVGVKADQHLVLKLNYSSKILFLQQKITFQ